MTARTALALGLTALLLAGCTAGSGQVGVTSTTDSFSYGGQSTDKTKVETYTWQNTQGKAMLSWGGQATSGSFTVTIQDADGKQVYSGSFGSGQGGTTANTSSGRAGDWTILLNFKDYTGQMGLAITASGGSYSGYGMPSYSP